MAKGEHRAGGGSQSDTATGGEREYKMSCRNFNRRYYEVDLERYLQSNLGSADIYVRHVPLRWVEPPPEHGEDCSLEIDVDGGSFSLFRIRFFDWPLERSLEEDFGRKFEEALCLLLEACREARDAAFKVDAAKGEGPYAHRFDLESLWGSDDAERLEPGPYPRDDDGTKDNGHQ